VFGVIAPTLVWPTQIEAHLSAAQIDAILAHEVTHVRRRDNLASVAHMAVQALFWFHPIVWWMASRLVDERERACDEDVIRRLGHDRVVYAESILKTCRFLAASPVPCVAGVTGSNLKKRIEHIMTGESHLTLSPWKKALLAVTAAAAIAAPFLLGVMTVKPLLAQEPSTTAAFDSTSVKANTSGSGMIQMLPAANRGWQATNVTLGFLVRMAFQLQDDQIVGGPNWLFEDRFDVMGTGTAPGRDGSLFNKVRSMLADRFHLATHTETRELPIFALVMARGDGALGSKLTKSTADCSPQANGAGRGLLNLGERPRCGFRIGPGSLDVGGQTMALFAQNLSRFVGGIVVDRTNLAGTFDIALAYAPQSARNPAARDLPGAPPPGPPTDGNDAPSIFTALVEQLGLKLEATRGPVEVVVIDRAEHPAAN